MDWAANEGVDLPVAGAALDHGKDDPYLRTRYLNKRITPMQQWADHRRERPVAITNTSVMPMADGT